MGWDVLGLDWLDVAVVSGVGCSALAGMLTRLAAYNAGCTHHTEAK